MRANGLFFIVAISICFASCRKDNSGPSINLDEEKFTSFQITFNPIGGGDQVIFGFEDLGDLGVVQAAASGPLAVNTFYDAKVVMFNRKVEPNKNLTNAIIEAGTAFQVYAIIQPDNIFQAIEYLDMDENGNPIGMNMNFHTAERFVVGNLRFVVKRKVDKSANYILGRTIPTGVGGETLIDANFEVVIQ